MNYSGREVSGIALSIAILAASSGLVSAAQLSNGAELWKTLAGGQFAFIGRVRDGGRSLELDVEEVIALSADFMKGRSQAPEIVRAQFYGWRNTFRYKNAFDSAGDLCAPPVDFAKPPTDTYLDWDRLTKRKIEADRVLVVAGNQGTYTAGSSLAEAGLVEETRTVSVQYGEPNPGDLTFRGHWVDWYEVPEEGGVAISFAVQELAKIRAMSGLEALRDRWIETLRRRESPNPYLIEAALGWLYVHGQLWFDDAAAEEVISILEKPGRLRPCARALAVRALSRGYEPNESIDKMTFVNLGEIVKARGERWNELFPLNHTLWEVGLEEIVRVAKGEGESDPTVRAHAMRALADDRMIRVLLTKALMSDHPEGRLFELSSPDRLTDFFTRSGSDLPSGHQLVRLYTEYARSALDNFLEPIRKRNASLLTGSSP